MARDGQTLHLYAAVPVVTTRDEQPPIKASELPADWKPGDSDVILDDEGIAPSAGTVKRILEQAGEAKTRR